MPSTLHYLQTFDHDFQRYLRKMVKRVIRLVVTATMDDIIRFVMLAISLGPHRGSSRHGPKDILIPENTHYLVDCVVYVLNNYLAEQKVQLIPRREVIFPMQAYFHMPRVTAEHHSKAGVSRSIYRTLYNGAMAGYSLGVMTLTPVQYILDEVESQDQTFQLDDLQRLIDSDCIVERLISEAVKYDDVLFSSISTIAN